MSLVAVIQVKRFLLLVPICYGCDVCKSIYEKAPPVPHVLTPKAGKTLQQSFSGIGYSNAQGHTECVEFIKQTLGAPLTSTWREGKKITQGDMTILAGTAIATFVGGRYPQTGSSGMHAAIYLGQNAQGIQVLDQWRAQGAVKPRTIHWQTTSTSLSNQGTAFSVIEW